MKSVTDLSIYDELETAQEMIWLIKSDLLERELVPFLKKQFTLIPNEYLIRDREQVITELQSIRTVDELQSWCDVANSSAISWNGCDSLTIEQGRQRRHVRVEQLVFVSAGKIIMEEWGGILDYMESLIAQANSEYEIAKAAYISVV